VGQPLPETRIILFDGVCDLCNGFVQFIIKRDPHARFRFGALQSNEARQLLRGAPIHARDLDTVVYLRGSKMYTRSAAAIHILADLGGVWSLFRVKLFFPRVLRDLLYRYIANRRYRWFGKKESCMVPTPELRARFIHGRL
jgi:predicted DCC family thiol-disulfide oxidoreductase YuxK